MQIRLRVITNPAHAAVYANFRRKDGAYERLTGVVDTGTTHSLLPDRLMDVLDYRLSHKSQVVIERAGVQTFEAIEAVTWVYLEDEHGDRTPEFECTVWFARTLEILIGFGGILDRCVLHLDVPRLTGYLELP